MESSQKHSKTELSYNPAILDIFPKKTQALTQKNICNSIFTAALFTIPKIWKLPKCLSIGECIICYTHTHTHTHIFNTYILNKSKMAE